MFTICRKVTIEYLVLHDDEEQQFHCSSHVFCRPFISISVGDIKIFKERGIPALFEPNELKMGLMQFHWR